MEEKVVDIMEDAFRVVDGLEKETNEGDIDGVVEVPFDINNCWEMCLLKISTMSIILTQWLWRMQ
jgi:hypothetical protein